MRLIDAEYLLYGLGMFSEKENGAEFIKGVDAVADMIESAETISPAANWTPCSVALPEKVDKRLWSRDVLATIKQKTGNCFVVVAYYHYGHEQWKTDDMTDNDAIDVLAWQPLPAAWREPENV